MNQQDKDRLMELAKRSGVNDWRCRQFERACTPEFILSLLEENEALQTSLERVTNNRDMWKSQCENQAIELGNLRRHGTGHGHSHECTACAHAYTPAYTESEDCPQCGWNGVDGYTGIARAAMQHKGD